VFAHGDSFVADDTNGVRNRILRAAVDEKKLRWLEVLETRGHIEDGKIAHWQVTVKIGATLD